jgi:hypothetical protein
LEACLTQSILVVLYLIPLVRTLVTKRQNFVVLVCVLMILASLTWIWETHLKLRFVESSKGIYYDGDCISNADSEEHKLCSWITISYLFNVLSYNTAGWFFAVKYWTLSQMLYSIMHRSNPDKQIKMLNTVMWVGSLITIIASILLPLSSYFGKSAMAATYYG